MISLNSDSRMTTIRDKVEAGERLSFDDGLFLYEEADLFTLGRLANLVRERKNGNFAYYNVNTHINPTNVCVYRCTFCAFRADLKSPKGYVMSDEQILERAGDAARREAHQLGLRSNATMLYGHIEKPWHRVDHLIRLRELQDETGGFQTFIPLAFHPENAKLSHLTKPSVLLDLRTMAVSRLMLDNFP